MEFDLTTRLLNGDTPSRDVDCSSTETVKVNVNGMNRKVVINCKSFDAMERSLADVLGLSIGSFSISYIDSDGDVIALPHARVTIDEMEEFKKVKSPRLIIRSNGESVISPSLSCSSVRTKVKECALGAAASSSSSIGYCLKSKKDEEDEEMAMMYEPVDSIKFKQQQQQHQQEVMADEDGEEETDVETEDATDSDENNNDNNNNNNEQNESSLYDNIPNWARVFSDRTTVRSIQDAMASHIVTDFVNAIGVSLIAGEKSATFQVMFSYGPKIYALFNDVFIKHPELKDVIGEMISFLALGPRNKKSCPFHKHGRRQRQRNASGERHHHHHGRRHHRNRMDEFRDSWTQHFFNGNANTEPVSSRQPIHSGVVCDGCSTNCELRAKSIQQGCSSMEKCGSRYIAGVRYKSVSVKNFDLCESCEASQVFQKSHGPFLKLVTPCQSQAAMPAATSSSTHAAAFNPCAGNVNAQANQACHRRRGFKHGFGFMGAGNESHGMKRHHEQSSCQQPSPFASLFSGACSSSSSIPAPTTSSTSSLSLLLDGSQEKKKDDKCAIKSLFAAASSFCSTIKSSDLKLSDEAKGKSIEKKKSSDFESPNEEIDRKLIKQGKDIMDTFMKAATVAPSSSIAEESSAIIMNNNNNNNVELDIDEVPDKWKSAIETLQSLGFVEWKRYLSILEDENGNLDRTIAKIVVLPDNS